LERIGPNGGKEIRMVRDTFDPVRTEIAAGQVDAQTGASVFNTTTEFDQVRNINGRGVFPGSIRQVMLYPVCPRWYAIDEDFHIVQEGKKLTFFWTHWATSTMLWTNENGEFEFDNCMATLTTCDRPTPSTPMVRAEYLKAGADPSRRSSIDWEKVIPVMNKGGPNSDDFEYVGKVTADYANGIVIIKGDLVLRPKAGARSQHIFFFPNM